MNATSSTNQGEFAIYSPNESATSDGAGFWSDGGGWTTFGLATRFSQQDKETLSLPTATGGDAKWVRWDEANASYGAPGVESVTIRLTLDVTYSLNGENATEMVSRLRKMCERAIGEGMLTGETDAEVDEYSMDAAIQSLVSGDDLYEMVGMLTHALADARRAAGFGGPLDPMNSSGASALGDPLEVPGFIQSQFDCFTRLIDRNDRMPQPKEGWVVFVKKFDNGHKNVWVAEVDSIGWADDQKGYHRKLENLDFTHWIAVPIKNSRTF